MPNQNRNQGNQPHLTITLKVGKITEGKDAFHMPLRVLIKRGDTPITNAKVTFKEHNHLLGEAHTDNAGEAVFNNYCLLSQAEKVVEIRALCFGQERIENVMLPKVTPEKKDDAETLNIEDQYFDSSDKTFTVKIRLMKKGGYVLPGRRCVINIKKQKIVKIVDRDGWVIWTVPKELSVKRAGHDVDYMVTVDGIIAKAYGTLHLPPKTNKKNNRRAFQGVIAMIVLWFICLIAGFNSTAAKMLWLFMIAFSTIAIWYIPWAFRDEVFYGVKSFYRRVRQITSWKANDSIVERITEHFEKKDGPSPTGTTVSTANVNVGSEKKKKESIVDKISEGVAGAVIWEIIESAFRRLIKNKGA